MPRKTPGFFVPLDVNYVRDAAIRRAGEEAELLYVRSLAHAKGARTNGVIPRYDLEVVAVGMRRVPARVAALVREGLWIEVDDGWEIRSWAAWNGEVDGHVEAGRHGNHVRWNQPDPDCELCQQSPSNPVKDRTRDPQAIPTTPPNGIPPAIPEGDPSGDPLGITPGVSQVREEKRREEKRRTSSSARADGLSGPVGLAFDAFWDVYPRKAGKQGAARVFERQYRRFGAEAIIAGAQRLAADPNLPEAQFIPHPSTWLHRGGWDDAPLPGRNGHHPAHPVPETDPFVPGPIPPEIDPDDHAAIARHRLAERQAWKARNQGVAS